MSTTAAPASVHLPAPAEVREVLHGLVDRKVEVGPTAPVVPSRRSVCSVATYRDPGGRVRAVAVLDVQLTVSLGAALSLLPSHETESRLASALEGGPLDDELAENVEEVLNVLASAFNVGDGVHVKLAEFHPAGSDLPHETKMLCYSLGRREDHAVEVDGYGGGRLALVLVA